ncbi:MAG: amino acid ABC transporter substrate-binding protein [endosymbiont of Galathealinum brachiosum]|uniref:Amino acid ABC transporter substrate-binding protein n=1 Tax=endosymbiont of Galathealinum brachiosum TaxID=2200906 RepID=A0A370D6P9_9GAMM|nr:MAG: amino acid ABC transporter substrate-binding protein [endosymbiont of Galathealinum brachiosum]
MQTHNQLKNLLLLLFLGLQFNPALADEITIGVSASIPPYIIKETKQGIELEILQEAFKITGHTINIEFLPFARTFTLLDEKKLDGIINTKKGMIDNVFYTDIAITFQNCVISLAKNNYPDFKNISFLKNKDIIAFQRASEILGNEFALITKDNDNYEEVASQRSQVLQFFLERNAEIIIIEENIFKYYRNKAYDIIGNKAHTPVKYHRIFPPTEYRFAFIDEKIRDDFNTGLKTIKSNGTYSQIIDKYERLML